MSLVEDVTNAVTPVIETHVNENARGQFGRGFRLGLHKQQVIWCFVGSRDTAESVEIAISSGLITHVAILVGNRVTSDTLDAIATSEVIGLVNANPNVKLILVRYLWETQPSDNTGLAALNDADYYCTEIVLLRNEARGIHADAVGLDTEPYTGETEIGAYFRTPPFTPEAHATLVATIRSVVVESGQVDYVLPAGSAHRNHPYHALAGLGLTPIAEGTYFDFIEGLGDTMRRYAYDITGMCLNTTKDNPSIPSKPCWTVEEVFGEQQRMWRDKAGVFIYPVEHEAERVARALAAYTEARR